MYVGDYKYIYYYLHARIIWLIWICWASYYVSKLLLCKQWMMPFIERVNWVSSLWKTTMFWIIINIWTTSILDDEKDGSLLIILEYKVMWWLRAVRIVRVWVARTSQDQQWVIIDKNINNLTNKKTINNQL